jgi:hypothetical protein
VWLLIRMHLFPPPQALIQPMQQGSDNTTNSPEHIKFQLVSTTRMNAC